MAPGRRHAAARSMEESFHGAVRRTAARRDAASAGARPPCVTHVFLGAKGGAGTTTVAVNCAVELARQSKRPTVIVDLKTCLGEVALFLGVRPRFTVLDAIENLHRLDKDFLRELVSQAQVRRRHRRRVGAVRPAERAGRRRDRGAAPHPDADLRLRHRRRRQHDQRVRHRGALCGGHGVPGDQSGRAVDPQRAAAGRAGPAARRRQRARQDPAEPRLGEPADRAEADRDRARLRHLPLVHERLPRGVDGAELRGAADARRTTRRLPPSSTASRASCSACRPRSKEPEKRRAFLGIL